MNNIRNEILKLENDLLKPDVRNSSERISNILDPAFIEFCSSGNIYIYREGDIFKTESGTEYRIYDFNIKMFSEELVLATYQVIKKSGNQTRTSLRSSVWKKNTEGWRMVFHQGTNSGDGCI